MCEIPGLESGITLVAKTYQYWVSFHPRCRGERQSCHKKDRNRGELDNHRGKPFLWRSSVFALAADIEPT